MVEGRRGGGRQEGGQGQGQQQEVLVAAYEEGVEEKPAQSRVEAGPQAHNCPPVIQG